MCLCVSVCVNHGWVIGCGRMEADYTDMEHYLEYLREHGRRESSIQSARITIRHLLTMLAEDGRPTRVGDIRLEDVNWLANNLRVKDSVRSEYIRMLSRMSVILGGPDYGKMLDILYNRVEPDRVFITMPQFVAAYRHAEPEWRLTLVLGAMLGLRRFEICGLRDEDLRGDELTVRGKGHGPEGLVTVVKVPREVLDEIESFREYKRTHGQPRDEPDDHIVQHLMRGHWAPVPTSTMSQHLRRIGRECGFRLTCHSLRRLYATTLVNDIGAELDTVRRLMRHADISTTVKCYVQADPTKMHKATRGLMDLFGSALTA